MFSRLFVTVSDVNFIYGVSSLAQERITKL